MTNKITYNNDIKEIIDNYFLNTGVKTEVYKGYVIINKNSMSVITNTFGPEMFSFQSWFNSDKFVIYGTHKDYLFFDVIEFNSATMQAKATGRKKENGYAWHTFIFDKKDNELMHDIQNYFMNNYFN